jgi:ATP-binding cassette, subfamily B, putative efflux pump
MSLSLKRFLLYAKPYWFLVSGAIFFGVLKFSLALGLPFALGYVFDKILLAGDLSRDQMLYRLFAVLALLTLAMVLRVPVSFLRSYLSAKAGHRTIFDIRKDLFRHIQRLSLTYHATQKTGNTISRLINDLNQATGVLEQCVISMSMDILFLGGVVVFLLYYDWHLASVSLVTLPLYGLIFKALNPRLRQASRQVQEEMEEMSGEVTEKLAGLQVVLAFAREKTEEFRFFKRNRRYYTRVLSRVRLRMTLVTVAEFLQGFGPVIVIGYGGYRVYTGLMTPGELLVFNGFLAHLYLPTRRLADYSAILQEKLAAMDRVLDIMDEEPDIVDAPHAQMLTHPQGRIDFNDVSFSYADKQPVLHGVDFTVEPGHAAAIVGRSGAGKSTLVNLVPRFYDVTSGSVRIDGHDVRDLTLRSLRENIGIVLQETILFSGTIRENILYGRHDATDPEMLRAARMAHVDEFVDALPDGYDTILGERGISLSGGQRQRLSIARAFLRDPRILILDEATSNLDSGAEQIIQDALRELMQGRTTLVIAHRLSTIVDCDFVVVLERGRIVQIGSHSELISIRGPYRQFCKEQFGAVELEALHRQAI